MKIIINFILSSYMTCSAIDLSKSADIIAVINNEHASINERRLALNSLLSDKLDNMPSVKDSFEFFGKLNLIKPQNCKLIDSFAGAWPFYDRKADASINAGEHSMIVRITIQWGVDQKEFIWLLFSLSAPLENPDFQRLLSAQMSEFAERSKLIAVSMVDQTGQIDIIQP